MRMLLIIFTVIVGILNCRSEEPRALNGRSIVKVSLGKTGGLALSIVPPADFDGANAAFVGSGGVDDMERSKFEGIQSGIIIKGDEAQQAPITVAAFWAKSTAPAWAKTPPPETASLRVRSKWPFRLVSEDRAVSFTDSQGHQPKQDYPAGEFLFRVHIKHEPK